MARGLAAAHQRGGSPFAGQWQAIFEYSWRLLSHLAKLQGRELRRGTKGGAGAISRAIAVGGLLLVLAGCGGGSSNVPEVGGQAPAARHEPVAQDLTITTNEDTPVVLKVLANDRDADGDLLGVVSLVQPRQGMVHINPDNTITYAPDARFNGTDTFAHTIGDGRDGTDTGRVTVTVLAVQHRLTTPSRSTTVAFTSDDRRVVAVNRETHSLSVIEVRDQHGLDTAKLVAEVAVGNEPRFVALSPDDWEAYVTNALDGTVAVVSLVGSDAFTVVAQIPVGTEPRGLAMTPNGTRLFVANHTAGTVSIIDPMARSVIGTVPVGGNPMAVAITNNGDADDQGERVFMTQFFAERVPGGPGEGFDTGKRSIVQTFPVANPSTVTRITLSPLANIGFTADRTAFCPQTSPNPAALHSTIFCPNLAAPPGSRTITHAPQGAFPMEISSVGM
jgi:YVTN family beta-propeller protein